MDLDLKRIEEFICRHFDGTLDGAEESELAEALAKSEAARSLMVEYMRQEGATVLLGKLGVENQEWQATTSMHAAKSARQSLRSHSWPKVWPVLLAASLLIALTFYIAFHGSGQTRVNPPETAVGQVIFVAEWKQEDGAGPVLVRHQYNQQSRIPLAKNMPILAGDRIETQQPGSGKQSPTQPVHAAVHLASGAQVDLAGDTVFECTGLTTMCLERGLLYADVGLEQAGDRERTAQGPHATAERQESNATDALFTFHTSFADVKARKANLELRANPHEAVLRVEKGAAEFTNAQGRQLLSELQQSAAQAQAAPSAPQAVAAAELWRGRRGAATPSALASYSTNFPNAENPISEGGHWMGGKSVGLDWNDIRTTPGFAFLTQPDVSRHDDCIALLSGAWEPDQYVRTVVRIPTPDPKFSQQVQLRLRSSISAHSCTGYEILGASQIVRWNGPLGNFTVLQDEGPHGALRDGDVFEASIVGHVITVYINGARVNRAVDRTYSTGNPGIGLFTRNPAVAPFGFASFTASNAPFPPQLPLSVPPSGRERK